MAADDAYDGLEPIHAIGVFQSVAWVCQDGCDAAVESKPASKEDAGP
jgi:hypothetical protein